MPGPRDDDPRSEPPPPDHGHGDPLDDANDFETEDVDGAAEVGTPEFEPIQVRRRYLEGGGPSAFDPSRFVGHKRTDDDFDNTDAGDDTDDAGRSGRGGGDLPRDPGGFRPGARELRVLGVIAALAVVTLALFLPPVNILSRIGGSGSIVAGEGFTTRARSSMPSLPEGLEAVSSLYDLEGKRESSTPVTLTVRLSRQMDDGKAMAFYTYVGGEWQRLASVSPTDGGKSARAELPTVPTNIAVLRRASFAHQLGVMLGAGDTLDAAAGDAGVVSVLAGEPATGDDGLQLSDRLGGSLQGRYLGLTTSTAVGAAGVNRILNDSSATRRHIDAIAGAALATQAAGVHIDYLGIEPGRRAAFTTFIEQLAERLKRENRGLVVTVPTPAGTAPDAYDWVALQRAANAVWLRAPADPAAYYDQLEAALRTRRENGVDLAKVSLVIDRRSRERAGDVIRALTLREALTTASAVRARVEQGIAPGDAITLSAANIDQEAGNTGLRWDDRSRAVMFVYAGRSGSQTIWIENRFSTAFRLDLARRYALGGVVVEGAGRDETLPDVWNTVLSYTNDGQLVLQTPYGPYLQPQWRATDGQIEPGSSSGAAVWRAPARTGAHRVTLVISDGVVFLGQQLTLNVTADGGRTPTPTPAASPTATATPAATSPGATATPKAR
ncbi:MAG: hypothetical protein WC211_09370 [Dehalococcoidia bacterium]